MSILSTNFVKRSAVYATAFIMSVGVLTAVVPFVFSSGASAATVTNTDVSNLATTVAAANAGDVIDIQNSGTISSQVVINKALTLTSSTGATITVAEGINAIGIQAAGVTIQNLKFVGPYDFGEGAVTRALEVSGYANITIQNNQFSHLRQPAYINGGATGSITGNYADITKGWVVETNSDFSFSGNSFGTNVIDIALIAGATNNYPDAEVVAISDTNNDAVVENQFGGVKRLSDAYVQTTPSGNTGDDGSKWNPYVLNIQSGLNRIVEGGTVHVANGDYTGALNVTVNGTKLIGQSTAGVTVTSVGTTPTGHAVSVEGVNNVTIENMSFYIGSIGNPGYALKAYNTSNLTLTNLTFTGRGSSYIPRTGGVDLNAVNGATITNVIAKDFSKNGFAVSAKYSAADQTSQNITFSGIIALNNAWAGVAFYTTNSAATVGADIVGVVFAGTNFLIDNAKGLEIVGDTDYNVSIGVTPLFLVKGPDGADLDLGNTFFESNSTNVINYQAADVTATDARFEGKKGSEMTADEREALAATIYDVNDLAVLGEVVFYIAPTDDGDGDGGNTGNNGGSTGGSTGTGTTTTTTTTVVTPLITPASAVLGASDDETNDGATDVEGVSTENKAADETKNNDSKVFGVEWYWWLLIILALAGVSWAVIAAIRRRNNEE